MSFAGIPAQLIYFFQIRLLKERKKNDFTNWKIIAKIKSLARRRTATRFSKKMKKFFLILPLILILLLPVQTRAFSVYPDTDVIENKVFFDLIDEDPENFCSGDNWKIELESQATSDVYVLKNNNSTSTNTFFSCEDGALFFQQTTQSFFRETINCPISLNNYNVYLTCSSAGVDEITSQYTGTALVGSVDFTLIGGNYAGGKTLNTLQSITGSTTGIMIDENGKIIGFLKNSWQIDVPFFLYLIALSVIIAAIAIFIIAWKYGRSIG